MVELRKRKASTQPTVTEKKGKRNEKEAPSVTKNRPAKKTSDTPTSDSLAAIPNVGDTISLDGFGGEIETNDGSKTSLKELVAASTSGVVLFTYPRASTPGCKFSFSRKRKLSLIPLPLYLRCLVVVCCRETHFFHEI